MMRHDQLCESGSALSAISGSFGPSKGCKCGSRAYAADPLPDDVAPIYADQKPPPIRCDRPSIWGYTGS